MTTVRTKRVYDRPSPDDGARVLVDRLWPRGLSREAAAIDAGLKDLAPSHELRRDFHAGGDWDAFRAAYALELARPEAAAALAELQAFLEAGPVTLLYGLKDETRNNAEALRLWLDRSSEAQPPLAAGFWASAG